MKKILLAVFFLMLTFAPVSKAQTSGFGIGLILGEPTGISVKNYISQCVAIDGAVAWSFTGGDALHVHADMLYHKFDQFDIEHGHLALYYGPGARLAVGEHLWLGARFPVGVSYTLDEHIFESFLELAPTFDLTPKTDFSIHAGIGIRFYF